MPRLFPFTLRLSEKLFSFFKKSLLLVYQELKELIELFISLERSEALICIYYVTPDHAHNILC